MKDGYPRHGGPTACTTIGSFDMRNLGLRYGYVAAYCNFEKHHPNFLLAFEAISQFPFQGNSLNCFFFSSSRDKIVILCVRVCRAVYDSIRYKYRHNVLVVIFTFLYLNIVCPSRSREKYY